MRVRVRRVRPAANSSFLACVAASLFAALAHTGCRCGRSGTTALQRTRDLGSVSADAADAADARACLSTARALLENHGQSDAGARASASGMGPGRRVFLALWRAGEVSVETAVAPTLADEVVIAARAMVSTDPGAASGRLELDVTTGAEDVDLDEPQETSVASTGFEGFFAVRDDGKTGFVLPGEVVQKRMSRGAALDRSAIVRLLSTRAGVPEQELASMRTYRFRADVYVESPGHDGVLHVVRGMVEPPAVVTAEALLAAVRRGADYLSRVLDGSGRYVYLYHPTSGRDDAAYGWLRHAGTTYALLEAYEEFGQPVYLAKSELALRQLSAHLSYDDSSQGRYVVDTDDEEQQKVGGAGLSLLAFSKHAAGTGKRDDLDTMRALARFIMKQQYPDGHFRSNADLEHQTGKKLKREAIYYPGEAVLALVRLYGIDPQPAYLEAARRGADFVANVRDAYASEDNQEHDHWISYAYSDLYRLTRNDAYLKHAFKIARAIMKKQRRADDAPAPDLVGTFYDGQVTPASTRVEAYDADILLSRFAGLPEGWLLAPAREAARSILGQQFGPDNDYWLKNGAKSTGGVRESLFVDDVRIDYVQHAMSAWLGLARILRDPAYGSAAVPARDPAGSEPSTHEADPATP